MKTEVLVMTEKSVLPNGRHLLKITVCRVFLEETKDDEILHQYETETAEEPKIQNLDWS